MNYNKMAIIVKLINRMALMMANINRVRGAELYKRLQRYILTEEQLVFNGYPRPDPYKQGRAIVNSTNNPRRKNKALNLLPDQRVCDRCTTIYKVDSKGLPIKQNDICSYHWGRPFQRYGRSIYSCCHDNPDPCASAKCHVTDTIRNVNELDGFVRTKARSTSSSDEGNAGVYALDCEMCYTTEGPELTRITVISSDNQIVYETLVKPDNPIVDYNTRFSGIVENDLVNIKTTIRDVQAALLTIFSDKTILIGHSLENDLQALKLIHGTVIDTSIVFPHNQGPPYKKALRTLANDILKKTIQNSAKGHDSAEDAITCMELIMWKIKLDMLPTDF